MNQEEIIVFIQKHSLDASPEAIKDALVSSGVSEEDIDQAWKKIDAGAQTREAPRTVEAVPRVSTADATWETSLLSTTPIESTPESILAPIQPSPVPVGLHMSAPAVEVHASKNGKEFLSSVAEKTLVRRHSAKFPAVAIIIASFVLGGGAFAYWSFIESVLSPAEVFENMAAALNSATSGTYSGTIELTFDEGTKERSPGLGTAVFAFIQPLLLAQDTVELSPHESGDAQKTIRATLSVSGGFDDSNPASRKGSFEVKLHALVMGQEVKIGMAARVIGGANYVKFDNISQIAPGYKKLEEEWIKFDLASVKALQGAAPSDTTTAATEEKFKNISAEAKEKINTLFKNAHLFTFMGHGKETIRTGLTAYHYGVEVDKEGLKQFLDGLIAIVYEEGIQKETFNLTPPSQKDASDSIRSVIDALQETSGDIWIGTEDFLPYRSEIKLVLQEPSGSVVHFTIHLDFDNWNKPITVTAPTKSISAEEVVSSLGFGAGNVEATSTQNYYDTLANECSTKESESCCRASVETMKAGNYTLAPQEGCSADSKPDKMRCADSYAWCQPLSVLGEGSQLSP